MRKENLCIIKCCLVVSAICASWLVSGCVSLKEAARGIAGTSTKILEESRPQAIVKQYELPYDDCYAKVKEVLKEKKLPKEKGAAEEKEAYIYREDKAKGMLAIYVSEDDTTPVGIFLTSLSPSKTQVEVSSPSIYAKQLISEKIETALKKGKEQAHEKEQL